mmetsp:Transcript_14016/g.35307  ORF Transcript_14016/g.35307 Transcript_14016/m.35307 type:complete len:684 (+) Transcript_14016:92-2143(+)
MRVLAVAGVFLPLSAAQSAVFTHIEGSADHATLESALNKVTAVKDALADANGPFTMVAPTDAAFTAALPELGIAAADAATLLDRADLGEILKYQVLSTTEKVNPLTAGDITTVQGMTATVTVSSDATPVTKVVGSNAAGVTISSSADVGTSGNEEHAVHVCTDRILLPKPVYQVASEATDLFSTLVAALDTAGLADVKTGLGLQNGGALHTVFAPTNDAFTAYLTARGIDSDALLADGELANIVKYHILAGKVMAADVTTGEQATLYGDAGKLSLVKDGSTVTVDGVTVGSEVLAGNGVIHQIPSVLMPNVVEVAKGSSDFSRLVEAVVAADLATTLTGAGPFTVFAPTNAAFDAYLTKVSKTMDELKADKDALAALLKYHVVPSEVMLADATTSTPASVEGSTLDLVKTGDDLTVNGVAVPAATANMQAGNGVVHVIGTVLEIPAGSTPTKNVVQTAADTADEFTHLVAALTKANLTATLEATDKKFTVFAPTDAAFVAAAAALGEDDVAGLLERADLAQILLYHVLGSETKAAAVTGSLSSMQGAPIEVTTSGEKTMVDGAEITQADIMATNGVVHVVSSVMLPHSLFDVMKADTELSTLVAALEKAKLDDFFGYVNKGGPVHTIFAPTNDAFTAFFAADNGVADAAALLDHPDLEDILDYLLVWLHDIHCAGSRGEGDPG